MKRRSLICILTILWTSTQGFGAEGEEAVQSIRDERRDTLLYGIDSQIIEVMENIGKERDDQLLDSVYAAFKLTRNPEVKISAIDLFDSFEYQPPLVDAVEIISGYEEESAALVVRAIDYVATDRNTDLADILRPLVESRDPSISRAAIRGIAQTGNEDHASYLLEKFEDSRFDEERKTDIILAFGELKSILVVDALIDILDDEGEDMTRRRYACDALGKIADPRALPAIERSLGSSDAMLRAYAVASIRYFTDSDIIPSLEQGLRDSFWRVRVSAAKALGELKATEAITILDFKARKDPETNVRDAAIRALAAVGSKEAFDDIREYYEDKLFPGILRTTAAELLAEYDIENSIDSYKRVVDAEWDQKDKSRILERTGYFLSLVESASLEPIFDRFLGSREIVLIIYGIRGAERNGFTALSEQIGALTGENNSRSVRREAISAIEILRPEDQ